MQTPDATLRQIRSVVTQGNRSPDQTQQIAEIVRAARGYRWVGIYEVRDSEIAAIAWTDQEAPAHRRFPLTQGLCGAAVKAAAAVVVGDVQSDHRYLTTFGSTRSEIVVPVVNAAGKAVGVIDVESERLNAFGADDTRFLEGCADAMLPVFSADRGGGR